MCGCESWTIKKAEHWKIDAFELWCWGTLESPLTARRLNLSTYRKSILNIHWKDWSLSSNTLATWCEEPTHLKRPWCWEGLRAGGDDSDRGWDGWMVSSTWWTWAWGNSGRQWRTGKPGMLQSSGLQRIGHDWVTEQQKRHGNNLYILHFVKRYFEWHFFKLPCTDVRW